MASSDTHEPKVISDDMKKEVGLTTVEGDTAPQMKSNIEKKINAAEVLTEVKQKLDARKPLTEIEANHAESVEHKALGHRPRADSVAAHIKSHVAKQGVLPEDVNHKDDARDHASENATAHTGMPENGSPDAANYQLDTKDDESPEKGIQGSLQEDTTKITSLGNDNTEKAQSQVDAEQQNDPAGTNENTDPAPKTETASERSQLKPKPEIKSKADEDIDSIQKYHADMVKNTEQKVMDTNTDA